MGAGRSRALSAKNNSNKEERNNSPSNRPKKSSNCNQIQCYGCGSKSNGLNESSSSSTLFCLRCGCQLTQSAAFNSNSTNTPILASSFAPLSVIHFGLFYESLPSHMRTVAIPSLAFDHPSNIDHAPISSASSAPSISTSISASASASSYASGNKTRPLKPTNTLPHIKLSQQHLDELMSQWILPGLRQIDGQQLKIGEIVSIPVPSQSDTATASSFTSSGSSSESPGTSKLTLRVIRCFPPVGCLKMEHLPSDVSAPLPSSSSVQSRSISPSLSSLSFQSTRITLEPYVFSISRQLRSVTILPFESSLSQSTSSSFSSSTQPATILKQFLKPHFKTIPHRHLFEGYVFITRGVQFRVASCDPYDGCLIPETDIFSYPHPLPELRQLELQPVSNTFPVDSKTNKPVLPTSEAAMNDYICPYFESHQFLPFTRESILSMHRHDRTNGHPPSLWKIVALTPHDGGIVTRETQFLLSNMVDGLSLGDYLKRQEIEDQEFAI